MSKLDNGLLNVLGALSLNTPNKCTTCHCAEICDKVGGETMCGYMRLYYLTDKSL